MFQQPAASVAELESEPQPQPQSESQEQPSLPAPPPPPPAFSSGKRVLQAQRQLPPKRVRFSAPLSPEFFDKTLPASTPLRKGGTPFRLQPSSEGPKLCGVLKTPQTNDAAPTLQTEAVSREADCGSPTLKLAKPAPSSKLVPEAVEEVMGFYLHMLNGPFCFTFEPGWLFSKAVLEARLQLSWVPMGKWKCEMLSWDCDV